MDRSFRQKVNNKTAALNKTLDQIDLTDLCSINKKSKNNKIHILLKYIWNITKHRTCVETQNISINLRRLKSHEAPFLIIMV